MVKANQTTTAISDAVRHGNGIAVVAYRFEDVQKERIGD